jgi:hypothetical protein
MIISAGEYRGPIAPVVTVKDRRRLMLEIGHRLQAGELAENTAAILYATLDTMILVP